jgi:hypothetical protein
LEANVCAASRTCGISISSSPSAVCRRARSKAVAQPALVVAQPALMVRPALITRPAQPGVELLLHRPLNDQPGAKLRQLRQRPARVIADPHGQQSVDPSLDLRRRRYGTSHGVGLLHSLGGLEGTYAVALTAPGDLQQLGDATRGASEGRKGRIAGVRWCLNGAPVAPAFVTGAARR